MKNIRYVVMALSMLVCSAAFAAAQVNVGIGIGLPNLSIGINLPMQPQLMPVPGYPVYYAPQVNGNYFFYDGMYWVYQDNNWYASSWYNGPWSFVEPEAVPLYVLRIPVRYYQQPPVYFSGWHGNAPPRWGQYWGNDWEYRRRGWDQWNHRTVPSRAPLPAYQRQYTGTRYPQAEQQQSLHNRSYRYQPRDKVIRQHMKQQTGAKAPAAGSAQRVNQGQPPQRNQGWQDQRHPAALQRGAPADPHSQPPQRGGEFAQKPAPAQPHPAAAPHPAQDPRIRDLEQKEPERGNPQEPNRGRGHGQNNKDDERGRDRNR